jgi:hypothetical protein
VADHDHESVNDASVETSLTRCIIALAASAGWARNGVMLLMYAKHAQPRTV